MKLHHGIAKIWTSQFFSKNFTTCLMVGLALGSKHLYPQFHIHQHISLRRGTASVGKLWCQVTHSANNLSRALSHLNQNHLFLHSFPCQVALMSLRNTFHPLLARNLEFESKNEKGLVKKSFFIYLSLCNANLNYLKNPFGCLLN